MNSTNDTLALTLWILSELLGEILASLIYILPLLGAVVILNIVFLWIFHRRIKNWSRRPQHGIIANILSCIIEPHEVYVLGYINGRISWAKSRKETVLWKAIHLLARQYFWIKNKFAR